MILCPIMYCELSLPLMLFQHCRIDQHDQVLQDYVIHSLVKMLSQTKLIVLPLQTKTDRYPNGIQSKIKYEKNPKVEINQNQI